MASFRRVRRVWYVAQDGAPLALSRRVRARHRIKEDLRVGVEGIPEELLGRAQLDNSPQVHHCYARSHVLDHAQVVRNEHVGQVQLILKVLQKVQYLGLDGDVEGRSGFVEDYELWAD